MRPFRVLFRSHSLPDGIDQLTAEPHGAATTAAGDFFGLYHTNI